MLNQGADPFGIIGQVLDSQFRVDRLVGEGGFSAVYRGHHLGLDEPIAIKCLKLPPSLSQQLVGEFEKRFRDESRILYRLSQGNLNIVRSIAGGTWGSPIGILVPFMVLEWMEGRSLANEFTIRRTVGKQGRSLEELLKVFESAADGLGYAHSQGVIHRDLNPGNFFFANTPQGQKLKVLDFGVAKILDDSTLNIERTHTVGQIRIFAPAYGSPEQFDDALGKAGASSDVYAFALILLEALRDRPVNDGTHLGEFAQRAIDPKGRPTPRALGVEVPDEVESVFARATKLRPQERWQSASEFWHALVQAASAASQARHQQAALETPSLGMPQTVSRSTKAGMAPPQGKAAPMKRMDKTMPVGAVRPQISGLAPRSPAVSPSAPRIENARATMESAPTAALPPLPPPEAASGFVHEEETRIGAAPTPVAVPDLVGDEHESDEVTRVGAPAADILRGLADVDIRPGGGPGNMATVSNQNNQPPPRPAAGQGPDPQQPQQGFPNPSQQGRPPQHAGTLMMNPGQGGFGPLPPPPQHQQRPQQGPPPQQMGQQPQMPTTPGIGVPYGQPQAMPQQMQQPMQQPQMGMPPQQMQQPPMQQQPMYGQPPQQDPQMYGQPPQAVDASVSPAGVPKKSSALLFAGIGFGVVVLIGVVIAAVVVASGGKTQTVASASASASAAPPPIIPTTSAEPENTAATPPPAVEDAGAAVAEVEVDAGATTANATPTPDNGGANTNTNPTPVNNGGGTWTPPTPTPVAVKDAGPPADPNAYSESAARSALAGANSVLAICKKEGGVTGPGSATVTFNPDGTTANVVVDAPYAGTPTGDCVKNQLKRAKMKSFTGSPQSVKDSFDIPK